jgi:hypothetical protein
MIRIDISLIAVNRGSHCGTTRQLLIRAHSASGLVERGGQLTNASSQLIVQERPARTIRAPNASFPEWSHHTRPHERNTAEQETSENCIPDTNPIESTFATVRHRTIRSKGCLSKKTALAKPVEAAQRSWRRLDGPNQLPKVVLDAKFSDALEVATPIDRQFEAAA